MEATSVYSVHIANFLSTCESLMAYSPYMFCLNPKMTANYRKSLIGMSKTDTLDAFIISDFARAGRIESDPWRGSQFLTLKRLTRHRLHLTECITMEKTCMVSNLYLKFSELQLLEGEAQPFSNIYGTTSSAVLTEFMSAQDIEDASNTCFNSLLKKAGTVFQTRPEPPTYCEKPPEILTGSTNACMSRSASPCPALLTASKPA